MLRNFGSSIAGKECSRRWVSRFLERNRDHLTSKWTSGIDRNRHQADSEYKYKLYFDLLHSKIVEYNIEPRNTYNMDEKGFLLGVTGRSKRVFSRQLYDRKEVSEALQDGSREWITLLACICGDGTVVSPAIIYPGKGPLQSSWLEHLEVGKHQIFAATSPSGWSNNDLGLAWLEQVFERSTKAKARSFYRLLLLDGHGSHVTMNFIEFCHAHKILLMVFPPHATHSLQPLDVVMFKPLSSFYSSELAAYLHRSQGLVAVKKRDFLPLFWAAWELSFTSQNVLKAFEATGVSPPNADKVLNRFRKAPSDENEDPGFEPEGNRTSWNQLRKLYDGAVKDNDEKLSKRLCVAIHSLQTYNEILNTENDGLREALAHKKKHNKKSKPLDLQQRQEYHGGAVFWSPRKVREARAREDVRTTTEMAEKLAKAESKQLKEAATLYKKKMQEEARVVRETAKKRAAEERKMAAEAKAAKQAQKEQEQRDRDAQKALQPSQRSNRAASKVLKASQSKQRRNNRVRGGAVEAPPAPRAPPKSTRTRTITAPKKYSD